VDLNIRGAVYCNSNVLLAISGSDVYAQATLASQGYWISGYWLNGTWNPLIPSNAFADSIVVFP
jgi:hypothetical protein